MLAAGVDVITLGNHTYRHREIYPYLDEEERILRPANFLGSQPGHGWCVVAARGRPARRGVAVGQPVHEGRPAGVPEVDAALHALSGKVDHVLVDMHAEATSEKVAMGWHLDGRVTAVVGTHTHVPTADARVLPGGTAYITDVGMTGPRGGVIGVKRDQALDVDGDADAGPVRDLVRGSVVERRRDPTRGRAHAGRVDRAGVVAGARCRVAPWP